MIFLKEKDWHDLQRNQSVDYIENLEFETLKYIR